MKSQNWHDNCFKKLTVWQALQVFIAYFRDVVVFGVQGVFNSSSTLNLFKGVTHEH
jgi:hypothetical protein